MIDTGRLMALYDEHADAVYGVALAVVADESLACDLTEEVFRDAARGDIPATELSLLVEVHRRAVTQLRLLGEVPQQVVPAALLSLLSILDEQDGQAVSLAYLGGRDYREVARALGVSAAESASRLRQGLRELRPPHVRPVASAG